MDRIIAIRDQTHNATTERPMQPSNKLTVCALVFMMLGASLQCCHARASEKNVDHFPTDTSCIVYSRFRPIAYCAGDDLIHTCASTGKTLASRHLDAVPDSIVESGDGKSIIVHLGHDSWVLSSNTLAVKRKMKDACAWWDGAHVSHYIYLEDGTLTPAHYSANTMDQNWYIIGTDGSGAYNMCFREVNSGDNSNGNCPVQRFELWQHMNRKGLRRVCKLMNVYYDPGSADAPTHVAVLDDQTVVFGLPPAMLVDCVGVLQNGKAHKLKDKNGNHLIFDGNSIVTPDTIVGLAQPLDPTGALLPEKYIYLVTRHSVKIVAVPEDTVLVTYKPRYGIGIGSEGAAGVTVRYDTAYVRN